MNSLVGKFYRTKYTYAILFVLKEYKNDVFVMSTFESAYGIETRYFYTMKTYLESAYVTEL